MYRLAAFIHCGQLFGPDMYKAEPKIPLPNLTFQSFLETPNTKLTSSSFLKKHVHGKPFQIRLFKYNTYKNNYHEQKNNVLKTLLDTFGFTCFAGKFYTRTRYQSPHLAGQGLSLDSSADVSSHKLS